MRTRQWQVSAWQCSLLLTCALVVMPAVQAQQAETNHQAVLQLLEQAQDAARRSDYSGVFTYQDNGSLRSSRIIHIVDGTGERERLEVLDGTPREFIRHNEVQHCIIPERKLVLIEKARTDRFPGLFLGDTQAISNHYAFSLDKDNPTRVAGRECQLVHVEPRSEDRYSYKFCVDLETKLLIKTQTVHEREVVDEIAFTMLQTGENVSSEALTPSWDTEGWKQVQIPMREIDISKLGWRIQAPPGFSFTRQLARPMKTGNAVKHVVLSDGLATISVFIERFEAANAMRTLQKGAVRNDAINVFGTRIGDYWLTVLGMVPAGTLQAVAEQTQYVEPPIAEQ